MKDQKLIIIILCTIVFSIFFIHNLFNEINATYVRVGNDNNKISNQFFSMNVNDKWLYQQSLPNSPPLASVVPIEDFENAKKRIHDYANIFIEQDADFDIENLTLNMYVSDKKESIQAKMVNETNVELDGEDAIKVNYLGTGTIEGANLIVIYAIHLGKPYFIQYMGFGDKFKNRLSDFQEMLSTFKWESQETTNSLYNTNESNYKSNESLIKEKNSNVTINSNIYQGLGIKIKYFDPWEIGIISNDKPSCHNIDFCVITFDMPIGGDDHSMIWIIQDKFDSPKIKFKCKCDTLLEYVKYQYENKISKFDNFSFVNDNQTIISENKSAIQLEYDFRLVDTDRKGFTIISNDSNAFYEFSIYADKKGSYSKNIDDFKKTIKSVEFLPNNEIKQKKPSFYSSEEYNELITSSASDVDTKIDSPDLEINDLSNEISQHGDLTILSHNSYINSIGNMHVIGEVRNNTPNLVEFVKIIGTFYDSNNKIVGTSFTFTDPSDLGPGEKAPFDLILSDSTIPTDQINEYRLKISYR